MRQARRVFQEAVVVLSRRLGFKVRPFVTSVRHSGRLLFSDRLLLYTNTGLSVGLSVLGDSLCQNKNLVQDSNVHKWDKTRTAQMAASGLAVGPVVHYWYLYLERWFPGRNLAAVVKKIALDQLVLSPVYIAMFLITIGVLEGQRWELMKEEFKDTGVKMFISDVVVWTPAQAVNFYFLPTRFRVLFDNSVSLMMDVWYSYLRFDYSTHHEPSCGEDKDCLGTDVNNSSTSIGTLNEEGSVETCQQHADSHLHLQTPEVPHGIEPPKSESSCSSL